MVCSTEKVKALPSHQWNDLTPLCASAALACTLVAVEGSVTVQPVRSLSKPGFTTRLGITVTWSVAGSSLPTTVPATSKVPAVFHRAGSNSSQIT